MDNFVIENGVLMKVNDESITEAIIPEGITSIGNWAFCMCKSLTSITIPDSVTSIGNNAFEGCSSLTNITIPDSVTSIGNNAFARCSSLTNITIPNSVTSIGGFEFSDCSSLTSITIPNSVTSIRFGAFAGCSSLESITIPNSVTSIEDNAFSGCESLTNITIPESVTSIGDLAFSRCESLTSITIMNSNVKMGFKVFKSCKNIKEVITPNPSAIDRNEAGLKSSIKILNPEMEDTRVKVYAILEKEDVECYYGILCDSKKLAKKLCVSNCIADIFSCPVVKEFEIDKKEVNNDFLVGIRLDKYTYISGRLFHNYDELYEYAADNGFREPKEEVDAYCWLRLNSYVNNSIVIEDYNSDVKIDKENKKVPYFEEIKDETGFSPENIRYMNSEGIKYFIIDKAGDYVEVIV